MIYSNKDFTSNSLTYVFKSEIGQRVKYTANTGMVVAALGNTSLTGSGDTSTLLTPGTNGTLVRTISIKAIQTSTRGMIRLFTVEGPKTCLLKEIEIPAQTIGAVDTSFEVEFIANWFISNTLKVASENSESFVVFAEGLDVSYP